MQTPTNSSGGGARPASFRTSGVPDNAARPLFFTRSPDELKRHPCYQEAKAGDALAALRLVEDLVSPGVVQEEIPRGRLFVPAIARERTGHNAIPIALARYYAELTGGEVLTDVVQINVVHHTGADPMERLVARPRFGGRVPGGARCWLVDDVCTLGGTIAELAGYIRHNGAVVEGVSILAFASRAELLVPTGKQLRLLENRLGDVIRQEFAVEPSALTGAEAGYLVGFRNADELRNRAANARSENSRRGVPGQLARAHELSVGEISL